MSLETKIEDIIYKRSYSKYDPIQNIIMIFKIDLKS